MDLSKLLPILKEILLHPYVIGTTIVIILYCNFVCYVIKYKKRPPKVKVRKIQDTPPAKTQEEETESDENYGEDEE